MKLAWKLFPLRADSIKWLSAGELHQTPRVNKSSDQPLQSFEGGLRRQLGATGRHWDALSTKGELIRKALSYASARRRLPTRCEDVKKYRRIFKAFSPPRLERGSQAPLPAWNSEMTSVCPRALLCSSIFSPTATHSIKRGQQILEIFFPARSKKSIQVSGDFPVWSDSDSWSPSGVRWPSSVSLPRPQTIDYTEYGLVSLAQQCFISYARSNIITVWARTGNQLRRKWMEKLHLCIENVINTPRHKVGLTYVIVHQSAHQNKMRQYIKSVRCWSSVLFYGLAI